MRIFGRGTPTRYQALQQDGWHQARTVRDVGLLTARWLDGDALLHPSYGSVRDSRPDDETAQITPTLVAANRAGFVTTNSQVGTYVHEYGVSRQRAEVQALVDPADIDRLITPLLERDDLVTDVHSPEDRRRYDLRWGGKFSPSRGMIAFWYDGVGAEAVAALERSYYVEVTDPVAGRDARLWPALDELAQERRDDLGDVDY